MTIEKKRGPRPRHNDPDPAATGENLRAVRLSRGISQKQLANALGYTTHVGVTHMESGRRGMSDAQLRAAADYLGVAPSVIRPHTKAAL